MDVVFKNYISSVNTLLFRILSIVFILVLMSVTILQAEDYRLELIECQPVSELKLNRPEDGVYSAVYSKDYKSYISTERLEEYRGDYIYAEFHNSSGSIIWTDTLGTGGLFISPQDDFFVNVNSVGGPGGGHVKVFNLSISSSPILELGMLASTVVFSDDGAFACLCSNEIVLCDSSGTIHFREKLRMRMSSKATLNRDGTLIAVGDLLSSSVLNEQNYETIPITNDNWEYINTSTFPSHLKSKEEIEAYIEEKKKKKEKLREEQIERSGITRSKPSPENRPKASGDVPQYLTLLNRNGDILSEISLLHRAQRISISEPEQVHIVTSYEKTIYLYDLNGTMICNYQDNDNGFVSSVAASDSGLIVAVINESPHYKNQKRKLVVIDFNGNQIAEQPLLDLWALGRNRNVKLSIDGDTITLRDNAEISIFRLVTE